MSIMNRAAMAANRQAEASSEGSASQTLAVVDPSLRRLRGILTAMSQFVTRSGDEKARRLQRIIDIVVDEAMDELDEHSTNLGEFLIPFARLMEWAATGDYSLIPDVLLPFAATIDGIDPSKIVRGDAESEEFQKTTPISGQLELEAAW